jgi:hypothetical protein
MPSATFITHSSIRILLIDLADITDYRVVPGLIARAIELAQSGKGPGSLHTLIDLSGTRVNGTIISALKNLSRNNGRYAKATAFVGLGTGWSLMLTMMFRLRGKNNHKVLPGRQEALAWLQGW